MSAKYVVMIHTVAPSQICGDGVALVGVYKSMKKTRRAIEAHNEDKNDGVPLDWGRWGKYDFCSPVGAVHFVLLEGCMFRKGYIVTRHK